jgi:hypothetical protein
MMKFESDLAPLSNVTVLPYGTPDLLDEWLERPTDEEMAEWRELTFDPDCDPPF